jgi:hypothetical protein
MNENIEVMKDLRNRLDKVLEEKESNSGINIQPKDTSKWHFRISIVKSGMRFAAGFRLIQGDLIGAGIFFIIAEALGIAEEIF